MPVFMQTPAAHEHTWTPKKSSQGCLFMRAHSEAWPCSKLVASAISPHVTSAPSFLHTRLHVGNNPSMPLRVYRFPQTRVYRLIKLC